jgi:hypothetical protein
MRDAWELTETSWGFSLTFDGELVASSNERDDLVRLAAKMQPPEWMRVKPLDTGNPAIRNVRTADWENEA